MKVQVMLVAWRAGHSMWGVSWTLWAVEQHPWSHPLDARSTRTFPLQERPSVSSRGSMASEESLFSVGITMEFGIIEWLLFARSLHLVTVHNQLAGGNHGSLSRGGNWAQRGESSSQDLL